MYILDNSSAQNDFVKMASRTRKRRSHENQEDFKHVLEEIWDSDPDETLCKIFSRKAKGRIEFNMNLSSRRPNMERKQCH